MRRSRISILLTLLLLLSCFEIGFGQDDRQRELAFSRTSARETRKRELSSEFSADLSPENVLPEYPRPMMVRPHWLNLNGYWELILQKDARHPQNADLVFPLKQDATDRLSPVLWKEFPQGPIEADDVQSLEAPVPEWGEDSGAVFRGQSRLPPISRNVTTEDATSEALPGLGSPQEESGKRVLVPFPLESPLSGIGQTSEGATYRRTFSVPGEWLSEHRILLHFGAVDWETAVFLDGKLLGLHRGGFDPFSFDITEVLNRESDHGRPHELTVSVFDPTREIVRGKQSLQPNNGEYTSVSGIWQTVWLEPVPVHYIKEYSVVADIDRSSLSVRVEVENPLPDGTIEIEAFAGEKSVAKAFGGTTGIILLPIPREHLVLWSPEQPFLYDLKIRLLSKKKELDTVQGYFGMRKIDLAKDPAGKVRIRLNNAFLFQMGVLDPGYWPEGLYTPPSDAAIRSDIEKIKACGFNMIRKHAKVEPQRWYYWCDRLGVLVWQDMPGGENRTPQMQEQFEDELFRIVDSLRNHPSLVVWVLFNEARGQHKTAYYSDKVRQTDPSRLIDSTSGGKDESCGQLIDIHKFPGPDAPKTDPFRAGVLGDFGGISLVIPEHSWSSQPWGYQFAIDAADFLRRYGKMTGSLEKLIETHGLSAAVYHQWSDVESEENGITSYDRKILKVPPADVRGFNQKLILGKETRKSFY